ncbi:hypothetical protein SAMN04487968_11062 [Nocardioides terrae]|uniref:Uncharacterized protein n=1 Tax=Nocardioides terrae TaxID=574651 RepID=A0A1I1LJ10_9ACTN|nr:hypothetical protein [Nocardioides terrae]SFC72552.1 hypothetical protein SAMN04487968_11062 [Nocardioides terrae]
MITSRSSRAPRPRRLLPALAAAAVMTSGLALATAPAHAEPTATPWQLGFDNPVATTLSADGAFVYALGTVYGQDDSETYVLDTVDTSNGNVTEKTLALPTERTTVDQVETQVDTTIVGPDGTVYAGGYREQQDEFGNAESVDGMLWTIPSDSSDPTATALDGFSEAQTLALNGSTLVVGGADDYMPVVQTGPVADWGTDLSTSPVIPLLTEDEAATHDNEDYDDDVTGDVGLLAVSDMDGTPVLSVAGRVYSGDGTTTNVLWHVASQSVTRASLAHEPVSMTADDAGAVYVGEAVYDQDNELPATNLEVFPANGGEAASGALGGEYPDHLQMSPDGAKVIGVGYSGTFAFDPAKPQDELLYTYSDRGTISDVVFSDTKAYAVSYGYDSAEEATYAVEPIALPWVAQPVVTDPTPTPPAPPVTQPTPPAPVVHLTPAQQKVANAQVKVTRTLSAIARAKAEARAAKAAHDKAAAKKLAKKVAKLKKQLKKQKAVLVKAKKAAKKATHKKHKH